MKNFICFLAFFLVSCKSNEIIHEQNLIDQQRTMIRRDKNSIKKQQKIISSRAKHKQNRKKNGRKKLRIIWTVPETNRIFGIVFVREFWFRYVWRIDPGRENIRRDWFVVDPLSRVPGFPLGDCPNRFNDIETEHDPVVLENCSAIVRGKI